jgi:hypothetical protein
LGILVATVASHKNIKSYRTLLDEYNFQLMLWYMKLAKNLTGSESQTKKDRSNHVDRRRLIFQALDFWSRFGYSTLGCVIAQKEDFSITG